MDGPRASEPRPFAVVTGASCGIGVAYARALAARGYDLLLVSRNRARLDQVAAACAAGAGGVACEVIDLAEPEAAHRLYAAARARRAVVDLLVNNAGFGAFGAFVAMPMRQVQEMLRLHVNTVVESIRLFLPGMIERGSGAIVTVASVAGFFPVPYMAEYAATKTFLITFCEALAEEVRGTGVRIQVCCPGSTETEFYATAGFRPRSPLGADSAESVVAESLAQLARGPVVATIGWRGRVLGLLSRCVPHAVVILLARRWTQPPAALPRSAWPPRTS